ncbi:MAG: acylphosphatase [Candidatus Omnitrophota bacterium]
MSQRSEFRGVRIYFSGIVQGVGFRFTARDLAFRHKIKGWVKNLSDGRVEITAQGESAATGKFLESLRQEFKNNLTGVEIEELVFNGRFDNFQIQF